MSEEYVSRVLLEINGMSIDDFKSVEEGDRELAAAVNLMNKTGHVGKLERHTVSVEYAVPSDTPEFDFSQVIGGRLTIDRMNGTRITYTGVRTTKIGALTYDGEKEATKKIDFMADKRLEE